MIFFQFFLHMFWFCFAVPLSWPGLPCCRARGLLIPMNSLLSAVASPVAEHGFWAFRLKGVAARGLSSCGSWALEHRLSRGGAWAYSVACETFLDQGSNLCLLHWQADSLPLSHQGNPRMIFKS